MSHVQVRSFDSGLDAFVWHRTNELFQHGDERVSTRKDANSGLVRVFDYLMRTLRGDAKGHPSVLNVFGGG